MDTQLADSQAERIKALRTDLLRDADDSVRRNEARGDARLTMEARAYRLGLRDAFSVVFRELGLS